MLHYIEDKSNASPPFCFRTVMKKQVVSSSPAGIASIFLLSFFSLTRNRKNMFKSDLVFYTVGFCCCCCFVFFCFWPSISWILSLFLLTLFASSFALVQLRLIFSFVPSFWSESIWLSFSKKQNCQLGTFCDICQLWIFCFHFRKAGNFAS